MSGFYHHLIRFRLVVILATAAVTIWLVSQIPNLRFDTSTAGLVPDKWLPRGRVSGKLQAEGPLSSPEVSLETDFRDGAVGGMAVAGAAVSLTASQGTVLLRRLEAETGLGALSLPLTAGAR